MTQQDASAILRKLCEWFPQRYPSQMASSRAEGLIQDLMEAFAKYKGIPVLEAYKKYHMTYEGVPSFAAIKGLLTSSDVIDEGPEVFTNYFEDEDGYGYAYSSKEKDYVKIWSPTWSRDRTVEKDGQTVFLHRKLKSVVLREKGIVNY